MTYTYKTHGTCSRSIRLELLGDVVQDIRFEGGCNGNAKGIASLAKGMKAEEVIERCEGIQCGMRPTSCPDQLSKALRQALEQQKNEG